ncbi:hypothetical protein [Flagellimonas aequoris]|nr:hypothetical protein [Allomuricauda aequoris]TXK00697.1 hypothetical protein FQ019_17460 [Allomuricauda aequoris]
MWFRFHHGHQIQQGSAPSADDKAQGNFIGVESLELEGTTMSVYLKQYDSPVLIGKQVFKNGDGSTGTLYLASSDMDLDFAQLTTIYEKRWKILLASRRFGHA